VLAWCQMRSLNEGGDLLASVPEADENHCKTSEPELQDIRALRVMLADPGSRIRGAKVTVMLAHEFCRHVGALSL
jgi:hypothetical protein